MVTLCSQKRSSLGQTWLVFDELPGFGLIYTRSPLGGNHRRVLGLSGDLVGRSQPRTDCLHLSLPAPGVRLSQRSFNQPLSGGTN